MGRRHKRKRRSTEDAAKQGAADEATTASTTGATADDVVECFSWNPTVAQKDSDSCEHRENEIASASPSAPNVFTSPTMEKIWKALQSVGRLHIPVDRAPTPIQAYTWPKLLPSLFDSSSNAAETTRLVTQSPTGSGKTLSYGLPLALQALTQSQSSLVLAPTRELAIQIGKNLKAVVKALRRIPEVAADTTRVNLATLYGGLDREKQAAELSGFDQPGGILVSTTGRLLDLIQSATEEDNEKNEACKQGTLIIEFLRSLACWVVDEADRLATHSDLSRQIDQILPYIPTKAGIVFASATWPNDTDKWKEWLWRSPSSADLEPCTVVRVNPNAIKSSVKTAKKPVTDASENDKESNKKSSKDVVWSEIPSNITQTLHVCADHKKPRKLLTTLQKLKKEDARQKPLCIVFFATIKTLQYCTKLLSKEGISCLELHSHMPQHSRERNIQTFSSGKATLLLATDICARGVHVNHVRVVIQYDFPGNMEQYIHRCGVSSGVEPWRRFVK